jgi:hypothetical protein
LTASAKPWPTTANVTSPARAVLDIARRVYGSANPGFTGTITGFVGADDQAKATTGALSFASPATALANVGSYAILGSGLAAANYVFVNAASNATALTINPKALTASLKGTVAKIYDGGTGAALAASNFQLSGFVGDQSAIVTQASGTYAAADVGTRIRVSATLAAGDFAAGPARRAAQRRRKPLRQFLASSQLLLMRPVLRLAG